MLIKKVFIDGLGCLKNFHIDFNEPNSEHGQHGTTTYTLIGKNGTGKSTFLEAILRIFGVFDSESVIKETYFNFEIEYEYASKNIKITREANKYTIWQDGNLLTQNTSLSTAKKKIHYNTGHIFPRRIISFYSGTHDNLSETEKKTSRIYRKETLRTIYDYLDIISENTTTHANSNMHFPVKKYIAVKDEHTDIYLISMILSNNKKTFNILNINTNNCTLEISLNLNKISYFIRDSIFRPINTHLNYYKNEIRVLIFNIFDFIDPEFSHFIQEHKLNIEINIEEKNFWKTKDFWKEEDFFNKYNFENGINAKIILKTENAYRIPPTTTYNFFEKLHTIFNAKFRVLFSVNNSEDLIYTNQLSEGERQFIKLLGMAIVSKNEECLILIDEVDAHINPQWKYNLRNMMQEFFSESRATQIIMATHDPLAINGVPKEEIKIFERIVEEEEQKIIAHAPSESTEGMGIDAILQSEYYGLKNSYDKATADKYQRRQELYLKLIQEDISDDEKLELGNLSEQLGGLPFANNTIDFIYDDFMQEFRNTEHYDKEYLSFDELQSRRTEIKRILAKIHEGK